MENITIYTDGSSKGNPGPGGWAAIISRQQPVVSIKEIGGRAEMTTNNRMEITAAIESLKQTPENSDVEIHTDSEYLINGITKWASSWQANGWRTKAKKAVLNQDLWEILISETKKREVAWKKVLGHSGHNYNERCDFLATEFADNKKVNLFDGPKTDYKI
jgi:ribonuclease HI